MDLEKITRPTPIGQVTQHVVDLLSYSHPAGTILIGPSNVAHMKKEHPEDYAKYAQYIPDILESPDFVGINPHDDSIQYVKEFPPDHVLVAVRVTKSGAYFARSIYVISDTKFNNYKSSGRLIEP